MINILSGDSGRSERFLDARAKIRVAYTMLDRISESDYNQETIKDVANHYYELDREITHMWLEDKIPRKEYDDLREEFDMYAMCFVARLRNISGTVDLISRDTTLNSLGTYLDMLYKEGLKRIDKGESYECKQRIAEAYRWRMQGYRLAFLHHSNLSHEELDTALSQIVRLEGKLIDYVREQNNTKPNGYWVERGC